MGLAVPSPVGCVFSGVRPSAGAAGLSAGENRQAFVEVRYLRNSNGAAAEDGSTPDAKQVPRRTGEGQGEGQLVRITIATRYLFLHTP